MKTNKSILGLCLAALAVALSTFGAEKQPVTNADVATMIQAGLPESTIVLAIRQGPADFDTSPAALIELKNQGATAAMLDAMMQPPPSPAPAPASQGTGNALLDAYYAEMPKCDEVVLIDGTNRVSMKYASFDMQSTTSLAPFGGAKAYSCLAGQSSACRVSSDRPSFEFTMDGNVQPATRVAMVILAVRGQSRLIQSVSANLVRASTGFPKDRIVAIDIAELKSAGQTASGQIRYAATPKAPLAPGEYALVVNEYMAYDFGIDATGSPAAAGEK